MAAQCRPTKHLHYDPSMSRRTRRPIHHEEDTQNKSDHMSLKELMNECRVTDATEEEAVVAAAAAVAVTQATTVVTDEKNLMVVVKQGGHDGVRPGGMVGRCVRVLNHLIKAKRDSKKRPKVRLLTQ